MFTNYGPYDEQQIELIQQDRQRQLAAIYTAPTFEGVSVRVGSTARTRASRTFLRSALTSLRNVFASAAQPLRHLPGRV